MDTNYLKNGICQPVEESKLITNCKSYDINQNCELCNKTYRLENQTCIAILNQIAQCQVQNSETKCTQCENGYFLGDNQETCSKIKTLPNCLFYNQFYCQKCQEEYLLNYNLYQNLLFNISTLTQQKNFMLFTQSVRNGLTQISNEKVCQKTSVKNCKTFQNFNKCLECSQGYFITSAQQCTLYPLNQIQNCKNYQTLNQCRECNNGFILVDNVCHKVEESKKVANCLQYQGNFLNLICSKCIEDHYLDPTSKLCYLITLKVENCEKISETKNGQCDKCKEGFVASSTNTICGVPVDNCQNYSVVGATSSTCSICNNLYYLNQSIIPQVCTLGTVSNCLTYMTTKNICSVCQEKFFLNSNRECVLHSEISNCENYHKTQRNFCKKCEATYHPFVVQSKCKIHQEIQFCETYNSNITNSNCAKCQEGYTILDNQGVTSCIENTIESCLIQDNDVNCSKCIKNYSFNEKQVVVRECVENFSYSQQNCLIQEENAQTSLINKVKCQVCSLNAFSVDTTDSFVCIKETKINYLYSDAKTLVENCVKYDEQFFCVQCEHNFFLKNHQCLSTCLDGGTNTQRYIAYQKLVNDKWKIRYCDTGVVSGSTTDLLMGYNTYPARTKDYLLLKCSDDITLVKTSNLANDNQYSNVDPDQTQNFVTSPFNAFPEVECPLFIANITTLNGDTLVTDQQFVNFKYVYQNAPNNDFMGLRCIFGKTGKQGVDNLQNCDTNIALCDTSFQFKNLPAYWTKFFSCNKCENTKIPVVAYQATSKNSIDFQAFVKFRLDQDDWFSAVDLTNGESPLFCMENTQTEIKTKLSLSVTNDKINPVPNCGGYFLNLSYNGNDFDNTDAINEDLDLAGYNVSKISLICAYCLPGYQSTFIPGEDRRGVLRCEAIQNCDLTSTQTIVDKCQTCENNFYYRVDGNTINAQVCVSISNSSTIQNCLAIDNNLCVGCNKGYTLNKDNNCVIQSFSNCQIDNFGYLSGKINPTDNFDWFMHFYEQGLGCQICIDEHIAIFNNGLLGVGQIELQNEICVNDNSAMAEISTLSLKSDGSDSSYIQNCLYYTNNSSQLECYQCQDGYLKNLDQTSCWLMNLYPNCTKLNNEDPPVCISCVSQFSLILVGDIVSCQEGSIANCQEYFSDLQQDQMMCKSCQSQYSLINNECISGQVENCDIFLDNNLFICQQCATGYWLIKNDKIPYYQFPGNEELIIDRNYCISADDYLNCQTPEFTISDGTSLITKGTGLLNCPQEACSQEYYYSHLITKPTEQANNDNFSLCLKYQLIENCKSYYDTQVLEFSNFSCLECEENYYRSNNGNKCIQRQNLSGRAVKYEISIDKIKSCEDEYYLNDDQTYCLPNPNGIHGCSTYQDISTCLTCDSNYFLESNQCKEVTEKVEFCKIYIKDKSCSVCEEGYYLVPLEIPNEKGQNFLCSKKIDHCYKQYIHGFCELCVNSYIFNLETKLCELIDLQHCVVFVENELKCKVCAKNYYSDENQVCVEVPNENLIEKCDQMENEQLCKICEQGYYLNTDKLSCKITTYDPNCLTQERVSEPQCSVCKPGFKFNKIGNCIALQDSLSIQNGCFAAKQTEDKCLVCTQGYHMNKEGDCVINIQEQEQPNIDDKSLGWRIKIILLQFVLLIFQ